MKSDFSIGIEDMPCVSIIGILPEERRNAQPIFISICLQGNFSKVAREGDLAAGVDYSMLQADLNHILKKAQFRLVETAVYCLCHWVLWRYSHVTTVFIKLKKPHALGGLGVPVVTLKVPRKKVRASMQDPIQGSIQGSIQESIYRKAIIRCADVVLYFENPSSQLSPASVVETLVMADGSDLFLQRIL